MWTDATSLKKLVNHPDMVFPACQEGKEGFEAAAELFPAGYDPERGRLKPELSGKLTVLDCLLAARAQAIRALKLTMGDKEEETVLLSKLMAYCSKVESGFDVLI